MDRYRYESGTLSVSAFRAGDDDWDDLDEQEDIEGFMVFDITRGNTDDSWLAFSRDRDDAERIVRLLNDDNRLKAQAAMRGGKEPS